MRLPRNLAEVLSEHVTLEVEGIDRLYLNVYMRDLQREQDVVGFLRHHRGYPFGLLGGSLALWRYRVLEWQETKKAE